MISALHEIVSINNNSNNNLITCTKAIETKGDEIIWTLEPSADQYEELIRLKDANFEIRSTINDDVTLVHGFACHMVSIDIVFNTEYPTPFKVVALLKNTHVKYARMLDE